MRITNVRAMQPQTPTSPPDWRTSLGQILVAVDTDAGITGYGVGGGGAAGIHVIHADLRDLLVGREAGDVEELWEAMYSATLPYGQKGLAVMALSGIDLALWDLRGLEAGRPLTELLGGSVDIEMPTYGTVWDDLDDAIAAGLTAFKLHVEGRGRDVDAITEEVRAARERVGPDAPLMVDAWMTWDLDTTLAVASNIAEFHVDWIEEPLPNDDLDGYAQLAEQSALPIAGGEHEFTLRGFRPWIERRLFQVLQPDVCWCGGLTQLIAIYEAANAAGVRVCPHRGAEVWSLPAIAALDNNPVAEIGRPWMTWVTGQPPIVDSRIRPPDAPGFGSQIDETSLEFIA